MANAKRIYSGAMESQFKYVFFNLSPVLVQNSVLDKLGLEEGQDIDRATFSQILQHHLANSVAARAIQNAQQQR